MTQTPEEQISVIKATRKRLRRLRAIALLWRVVRLVLSALGTVSTIVGTALICEAYKKDGWTWIELVSAVSFVAGALYVFGTQLRLSRSNT